MSSVFVFVRNGLVEDVVCDDGHTTVYVLDADLNGNIQIQHHGQDWTVAVMGDFAPTMARRIYRRVDEAMRRTRIW